MSTNLMKTVGGAALETWLQERHRSTTSAKISNAVRLLLSDIERRGTVAVEEYARKFDGQSRSNLTVNAREIARLAARCPSKEAELFDRVAHRISHFASFQRRELKDVSSEKCGFSIRLRFRAVESVGVYVPAGGATLPSSLLMGALTAKAAGVRRIVVAASKLDARMAYCCKISGVTDVILVGGAQAIGALTFGYRDIPPVDMIVGPGGEWVDAAKRQIAGRVRIDAPAGPSEICVICDGTSSPNAAALDLIAQAEHDPIATIVLLSTSQATVTAVRREIEAQLAGLPRASVARKSLARGCSVVDPRIKRLVEIANRISPEHLAIHTARPKRVFRSLEHFGAAFVGSRSAEVFGDYGVGINHILPTGGAARSFGGLSVMSFLRSQASVTASGKKDQRFMQDCVAFARLEGLEAHARAAELRMTGEGL